MVKNISLIIPEHWHMDGGVAFGVVPKGIWNKLYPSDENNNLYIVNRLMLVETDDRLILVNTGFGNKRNDKYYSFKYISKRTPLLQCIAEAGYSADDVTDVIFTHLHDDHCGGTTAIHPEKGDSVPVLNNARYWISEKQWNWALNPNPREAASYFPDNLLPLLHSDKLTLLQPENQPFLNDGIELHHFDGHTGGQMIPILSYKNRTIVFTSDLIPSAAHIPLPYIASVDINPIEALKEKEAFLKKAVDFNYILIFEHDAFTESCIVVKTEKGYTAAIKDAYRQLITP